MSSHPRPSPATLADLDDLPEDLLGEIIDGVLYTRNRPSPAHQYAAAGIVSDLVPSLAVARALADGGSFPSRRWPSLTRRTLRPT